MRVPPHQLPDELVGALQQLGSALARGEVPADLLAEAMAGIARLEPHTVSAADWRIAQAADLRPDHRGRPSLLGWLGPSHPARDLVRRRPELAPLFIFHADGFAREAALDLLSTPPASPFALAALVLRLNDWAEPVRAAARRSIERLLPRMAAEIAVAAGPFLLDRWRRWGRWQALDAAFVEHLYDRPDVAAALATRLARDATGPMAATLRNAMRRPALDGHLPTLARDAVQPAVRAAALQTLIQGRASWPAGFGREWVDRRFEVSKRITLYGTREVESGLDPLALIRQGLGDRSALVRKMAADALIERRRDYPDLDAAITALLADRSRLVRERGDFLARKRAEAAAGPG